MFKKYFIIISICLGIPSSAFAASLSAEEKGELETLQRLAVQVRGIESTVARLLQDKHQQTPTRWIEPPVKDALPLLVELCSGQGFTWPSNLFPQSIDGDNKPTMLQDKDHMREIYRVTFLSGSINSFMDALTKRRSTGEGLSFDNVYHLRESQIYLDGLTQNILAKLFPCIEMLQPIHERYRSKYCTITFLLMQSGERGSLSHLGPLSFQERFGSNLRELETPLHVNLGGTTNILFATRPNRIEPSLKTTTATVQDEFIKTKLFLETTLEVHGSCLNAWGNLMRLYALKYKEVGDGSLMERLPKVEFTESPLPSPLKTSP